MPMRAMTIQKMIETCTLAVLPSGATIGKFQPKIAASGSLWSTSGSIGM